MEIEKSIKFIIFLSTISYISIFSSDLLANDPIPNSQSFNLTLQLAPGQRTACALAFSQHEIHAQFSYSVNFQKNMGMGYTAIHNIGLTEVPFKTDLYMQGMSDFYGFYHYFMPMMPAKIGKVFAGIRGIVLNICPNRNNSVTQKQADLMLVLPTGESCELQTPIWDGCR